MRGRGGTGIMASARDCPNSSPSLGDCVVF